MQTLMSPEASCADIKTEVGWPTEQPESRFRQFGRRVLAVASLAMTISISSGKPAAADQPTSAATPPALEVGVATGSWNDDGLGHHTICRDVAAAGEQQIRFNLVLSGPKHPWREMRAEINSCLAHGVEPIVSLPPALPAEQAANVVTHLPRLDEVVYGNEPNSPLFSGNHKPVPPRQYVTDLAKAYQAMHRVRPGITVDGFALASGYQPLAYFEACKNIADAHFGGLDNVRDINDIHLYHSMDTDLSDLQAFEAVDPTGVWRIGETGFIVNDQGHPGAVTQAEQAINEVSLITHLELDPKVIAVNWFRYRSSPTDPFDTANVSPRGFKRPAYYMLRSTLTGQ